MKKDAIKSHVRNPLKIYFLLMTLVGVIGTLIALGFLIYAIGKKVIITDNEYILGERYYELDQCSTTTTPEVTTEEKSGGVVKLTDEKMVKCKREKKVMLIQARSALFKEDMLSGGIRTFLFLILLLTHYPKFMRLNKKD